ncbi:C-type lectin domain family 1 member B-like [Mytilus edulis]|uniref:C-type lectin domain family 1 member B-like n=1 Tax=Mytilus edulis TaxID=6550 RepID=UPI0039EE6353
MKFLLVAVVLMLELVCVLSIQRKTKNCKKKHSDQPEVKCNQTETNTCLNIDVGDKTVGAVARLSCRDGFNLIGDDYIVCLHTGNWSNINATCVPRDEIGGINVQSFGGSKYVFVNFTQKNYSEAEAYCTDICGSLVEINNKEEDDYLMATTQSLKVASFWIGLKSNDGSSFEWPSGNTIITNMYQNFVDQRYAKDKGSCVLAYNNHDGNGRRWEPFVKEFCDENKKHFVCELMSG